MIILNSIDEIDEKLHRISRCITVDFDDTLLEHTGMYNPIPFFSAIAEKFPVVIVTSRAGNAEEIEDFCFKNNIHAVAIIYNAGLKIDVLKKLGSVCHFDDDRTVVSLCIKNGIPSYLAGAGARYKFCWFLSILRKGHLKWYIFGKLRKTKAQLSMFC